MIHISNLIKKYGTNTVIDDFNLDLSNSFILGLIGRNGCGKTTLFRILLGLTQATSGSWAMLGEQNPENYRKKLGVLLDDVGFDPGMTGKGNLQVFASIADIDFKTTLELTEYFQISFALKKRVGIYSLGMKRRLGLAALFSNNKPLYILDEPSNGLDIDGQDLLWAKIKEKHAQGSQFIITSHILTDVENICTHIVAMDAGKKIFDGTIFQAQEHGSLNQIVRNKQS